MCEGQSCGFSPAPVPELTRIDAELRSKSYELTAKIPSSIRGRGHGYGPGWSTCERHGTVGVNTWPRCWPAEQWPQPRSPLQGSS